MVLEEDEVFAEGPKVRVSLLGALEWDRAHLLHLAARVRVLSGSEAALT